ncbi:MAG: choice-of-anchor B family protein [Flavobacteriales bacterium]|nr:choice-of-anchor B family protein [Flavobacteriales bacterium]
MKSLIRIFALVAPLLLSLGASAQNALNITQLGHLLYAQNLSEVRGAEHNGREYALVGVQNGFSIVDVEDPANPTEVFFEQGPSSIWRDPFYYNGHAYCVTEGGGGLLIVDMSPLPASTNLTTTLYTGQNITWSSAHNMFIDTENDKAYIFGSNTVEGAIILDISNPIAPVELGVWNDHYIHDGFVRGDTLWASCLEAGTFVVDVSNPSNPVVLTSWDTPSEFGHNVWPSDDNAFCYTTDEVESGYVTAYDMANYQNIVEADKANHPLSENVIPHNTHFINDYVVTSHYRDGLTIHDVSDPYNMVLTGYFDSSPLSGGGFNGAWGAWPYLPSGNILIADIEEGLFVVGATYKRAARLEGTVTEFGNNSPINDVLIEVSTVNLTENSNLFGNYATGTEAAGTYTVTFTKGGFIPVTINNVELINGQTTVLNVDMVPEVPFSIGGTVSELGTGNAIEGASVHFTSQFFDLDYESDANGEYLDTTFFAGQYEVIVTAWGYVTECTSIDLTEGTPDLDFELARGYYDDFATDLGWAVTGSAPAGVWERGIPVETIFDGSVCNPGEDISDDCGEEAYITGNGGGNAGTDDVDDGVTILRSPLMDLTSYTNPTIQFDYWFFNAGGSGSPNDSYVVKVNNGSSTATIANLPTTTDWEPYGFTVSDFVSITDQMQLIVEVADADPGHLVEGGLDNFQVQEGLGMEDADMVGRISVYPNPSSDVFNVMIPVGSENVMMRLYSVTGSLVMEENNLTSGQKSFQTPAQPGVYICEFFVEGNRQVSRLVVQ